MNLVNTSLSTKYGDPRLKVSIYGPALKSSLYISLITDQKLIWQMVVLDILDVLSISRNLNETFGTTSTTGIFSKKEGHTGPKPALLNHT